MIGDGVRLWVRGHHFFAPFKGRPDNQRLAIPLPSRDELATHLERRCALGGALFHILERQRHFPHLLEGHRQVFLTPYPLEKEVPLLASRDFTAREIFSSIPAADAAQFRML
jgi:hypothetical protein